MDLIRYCLDFTSGSPKIAQHDLGAYVRFEQAYSTIEGYKEKVERLAGQVGIAESAKQNVLKENRLLNDRVDSLVFTNSSVHRENNTLQRENEELKETIASLEQELKTAQRSERFAVRENQLSLEQTNSLLKENDSLKEKLKACQLDLQVERETHHVTESGLNEVLDELKESKKELDKMKSNENQLVSDFLEALEVGILQGSREDRIRKLLAKVKSKAILEAIEVFHPARDIDVEALKDHAKDVGDCNG